jgi:hypothetical protein
MLLLLMMMTIIMGHEYKRGTVGEGKRWEEGKKRVIEDKED